MPETASPGTASTPRPRLRPCGPRLRARPAPSYSSGRPRRHGPGRSPLRLRADAHEPRDDGGATRSDLHRGDGHVPVGGRERHGRRFPLAGRAAGHSRRHLLAPHDKGLSIPAGSGQAGTLRLVFTGLSLPGMAAAHVRTTAASCNGAAGLSYPAWTTGETSTTSLQLFGLRSSAEERTNLAVVNAGTEGTVTLKVVLRAGDGRSTYEVPLRFCRPSRPGEWRQVNDVDLLRAAGFTDATALVTRLAGRRRSAPTPSSTTTSRTTGRTSRRWRAGPAARRSSFPSSSRRPPSKASSSSSTRPRCRSGLTDLRRVARGAEGDRRDRLRRPRAGAAEDPPPRPRHAPDARPAARAARRRVVRRDPLRRLHALRRRTCPWPRRREDGGGGTGSARGRGASGSSTRRSRPRPGRSSRPSSTGSSRPRRRDRTSPSSTPRPRTL